MARTSANFLNGVPELLILQILGQREMYGYEIVQAIKTETQGRVEFAEGVIYPLLHSLERDGALQTRRQTVEGRRRIYYRATKTGTKRLNQLSDKWRTLADAISTVLDGPRHA